MKRLSQRRIGCKMVSFRSTGQGGVNQRRVREVLIREDWLKECWSRRWCLEWVNQRDVSSRGVN